MRILGLDLETNGLDVRKCAVVEMGLCLWDVERQTSLASMGFIVNDKSSPTYNDWKICEKLSGITKDDIDRYGVEPDAAWGRFVDLADEADFILAANGLKFDKLVLSAFKSRYNLVGPSNYNWVDLYQFPFPENCKHRNLLYLAAYYGFINPFPHRALSDTLTMMKITANFDINKLLERQASPAITLVARVSYERRQLASERGFTWNGTKKSWIRVIHECELAELMPVLETYPFEIEFVEGDLS